MEMDLEIFQNMFWIILDVFLSALYTYITTLV